MSPRERRARRIRLQAPDGAAARRGALLLEDAMHTASLPDGDTGTLLLVRSLDVGVIHTGRSPASLALAIEQRLRQVRVVAVHGEDPVAPVAPAVYFRDVGEALGALATRIADGARLEAWPWCAVLAGWTPETPREEALRSLLARAAGTAAGPHAVAAVLDRVREGRALGRVLRALRPADAAALLRRCGWDAAGAPPLLAAPPEPPPAWARPLAEWTREWGADDPRSLWLATVALVAQRPGRAADPALPSHARILARRAAGEEAEAPTSPADRDELSLPPPSPRQASPQLEERSPRPQRPPDPLPEEPGTLRADPAAPAAEDAARGLTTVPGSRAEAAGRAAEPAPRASASAATARDTRAPRGEARRATDEGNVRPGDVPRATAPHGEWSEGAGLFFLLPVLARLGLADLLARHPALLEAELPARLLSRVAERVGVPPADPARAALAVAGAPPACLGMVAPLSWLRGIAAEGEWTLRRGERTRGARYLFDASGRLPLALWRRGSADRVRALVGPTPLRRGLPLATTPDLELVLHALHTALRRWVRRATGVGLHTVVRRPGRLLATRTHLDVLLDVSLADARVRRAGLDLDPGWVPWLGRVVSFHYLHGELRHG